MIHFVVAETNPAIQKKLKNTIESTMFKSSDLPFQLSWVQSKKEIEPFIQNDDRKVYILDIYLEDTTAIEVTRMIREENSDWESIILILSLCNDYFAWQRLLIFDYISLFKEEAFDLLEKDIRCIIKREEERKNVLVVMSKSLIYRINFDDILYITRDSFSRKSCIVTETETISTSLPLYEIEKELPSYFLQVQRSFIVNIHQVSFVNLKENTIYFRNRDDKIWFSRRYAKTVREKIV